MKVLELAQEFRTTTENVLEKLRKLHLKAKDGDQELSKAVVTVLKTELLKDLKEDAQKAEAAGRAAKRRRISDIVLSGKDIDSVLPGKVKKKSKDSDEETAEKKTDGAPETVAAEPKTAMAEAGLQQPQQEVLAGQEAAVVDGEQPVKKEAKTADDAEELVVEEPQLSPEMKAAAEADALIEASKAGKPKHEKGHKEVDAKVVPDEDEKIIRPKFVKGKKDIKAKAVIEPFIPLKPFNKKKKKSRFADGIETKAQPGLTTEERQAVLETSDFAPNELKPLEVQIPMTVKDFANAINQKTGIVLQKLIQMNVFANINQNLGEDVIESLAKAFGYEYIKVKTQEEQILDEHREEEDDPKLLTPRAPVITFMGHVDHGKTSLLDRIRKSQVADSEHGGITQHIGAYSVVVPRGTITFLDTPGHEAFTAMRARGAHITDIVVLVIAADEGIMPQTDEAIAHARAADVPIVVALNKIDREGADLDRVKKQLSDRGLLAEDWGGQTITVPVSAATGEGVDRLLEMILLESEMLELKANKDKKASGIVVEAHLSGGRGSVATMIVQAGTLHLNDFLVLGPCMGKVKAMFDDHGRPMIAAGPSTPVEVLGIEGVPDAGSMFYVVDDERTARDISQRRQEQVKGNRLSAQKRVTLEDLYSQIQAGQIRELNVILKADVQGSLEALCDSLAKIPSEEVKVKFIHMSVGDVNASDVILAVASNAIIIAFHVGIDPRAAKELESTPVDVRQYRIIYDAVNDVRRSLEGLLAPKVNRKFLGRIEVRQVFKLSKSGMVAGCFVVKGKASRKMKADVVREGEVVHTSEIGTLKRFKDDVREVAEGYECGLTLNNYDKLMEGDILELYELEQVARTL